MPMGSGRPPMVAVVIGCTLVKLACQRPQGDVSPFREVWTHAALSDALFAKTAQRLAESEVGRILRFEGLRPHRIKQWLHCPDPDFG
jgi:hypothetical protein